MLRGDERCGQIEIVREGGGGRGREEGRDWGGGGDSEKAREKGGWKGREGGRKREGGEGGWKKE